MSAPGSRFPSPWVLGLAVCVLSVAGMGALVRAADAARKVIPMRRFVVSLLAVCFAGTVWVSGTFGAGRSAAEISQEGLALNQNLAKQGLFTTYADLMTPDGRTKFAGAKEPLLKLAGLLDELSGAQDAPVSMGQPGMTRVLQQGDRMKLLAMASSLGNDKATKQLATLAASPDKETAAGGKMGQELVAWLMANGDATAEGKILERIEKLAKDNPTSNVLPMTLASLWRIRGQAPDIAKRIDAIFAETFTGASVRGIQYEIDKGATQKNAVGKAFELAGKTTEGKDFSTKEYAGKVVLVEFWATWTEPSKTELPRVKAMHAKYHAQGLEIVGVSCDGDGDALAKYTKGNAMPWVELWDKETQSTAGGKPAVWPALARQWRVTRLPQMFLIDRSGVLRTVEGLEEMEKMIPKLLEEKAGEGQ